MLIYKIHGKNSAATLYTRELMLQCKVAEYSFRRLKEAARVQVERDFHSTKPRPRNVYELFADCSAFLSASGVVAKILYSDLRLRRSQQKINVAGKRSLALREVLKLGDLPTLRSLGVRNAFEHVDERIDERLREDPSGDYIWVHFHRSDPPRGVVLKRFDPKNLTLSYLGDTLDIGKCFAEIQIVDEAVNQAHGKVREHQPLFDAVRIAKNVAGKPSAD